MKSSIISLLDRVDQKASKYYLRFTGERDSLVVLLFHSLFKNEDEIAQNVIAPQQGITVDLFGQIVEHFLQHDYCFANPNNIIEGLERGKKHVLLTFDDGYFNNMRALPVLKKYDVSATFFISTNHVLEQTSFWWDSLHRFTNAHASSDRRMQKLKQQLKTKTTCEIHRVISEEFGKDALVPKGDIDRPFTALELGDFSKEKHVHIGNHTADHAILTNYDIDEAATQIRECQVALTAITKNAPVAISYPNGDHSPEVTEAAKREGLQIGITGIRRKNYIPIAFDGTSEMRLGRMVPYGNMSISEQCRTYRADIGVHGIVKNAFNRMKRV